MSPLVSVILVARNAHSTIGLASASLLAQTLTDWQCIIINDASADETSQFLASLKDERFTVVELPRQLGRAGARNKALDLVRGKYLATLDADDFLYPDALAKLAAPLESDPSLGACTGALMLMSESCKPIGRRRTQLNPGEYDLESPLTTRLPLGSTVIRNSLVGKNRFDPFFLRTEDRDFFDRVLHRQKVRVLSEQTYAYRWGLELQSVLEGLQNREALLKRHWSKSWRRVLVQLLLTRLKLIGYPFLDGLGLWQALNYSRAIRPNVGELKKFKEALGIVNSVARAKDFPLP